MKRLNRKGFTLIELIATITLLAVIMGIGSYSISEVLKASKEKDYQLLIENIHSAVEEYYIECRYAGDSNTCQSQITLGYLVNNGYLKGNSTDSNGITTLVNPNDKKNISDCKIAYKYDEGKITIEAVNPSGSCPTSY